MAQTEKRSLLPILLIAAGVIVLVVAVASVFFFSGGDQPALGEVSEADIPLSQISRVDVATANSAQESGQAVIVDVRDEVYYDDAHIAGAVSIPLVELESRMGELNQGDWIIPYCT